MKFQTNIILIFLCVLTLNVIGQINPGAVQSESILILGGTAHLGNGDKIEGAAIGFANGKIDYVGSDKNVDPSTYDNVIDNKGKHVYPGFIAPNSTLGLQEIDAVRATVDQDEVGNFMPNIRSIIAYNTDSEVTPTARTNGVLMGQITPRGGWISGTSSVVQFDAWNWEDAIIREDDGIHLNWPQVYRTEHTHGQRVVTKHKDYASNKRDIEAFFRKAQAYATFKHHDEIDVKMEGMRGLFDATQTLYVHADDVKQIAEVVTFRKALDIEKLVLVGGYDSWMMADMLRENEIPVMIRRVHSLPKYTGDDVDLPYKLAKLLQDEGVLFCFENSGSMERMQTRNLPFLAGTAISHGLEYEQAVAALTLNTAKILGIDQTCGSLEMGKDATLFISDGDALDITTNKVVHAFIQGRTLELQNRQEMLYLKYKAKYDQQRKALAD